MGLLAKKACLGVVELGAAPALLAELRSWNFPQSADVVNVRTMGACDNTEIAGVVTERVEIECYLADPADAAQQLVDIRAAAALDFILYPFGKTAGKLSITGTMNVLDRSMSGDVDGAVEFSFAGTTPAAAVEGTVP